MVVVLEQLSHHNKSPWCCIFRMIAIIVISIPYLMPKPVYDCPLYGTDKKMNGEQEKPPIAGSENNIERCVQGAEQRSCYNMMPYFIYPVPHWNILLCKLGIRKIPACKEAPKNNYCMNHHVPYIFKKMGGMRVLFSITISMVHTVHYRVGPRNKV